MLLNPLPGTAAPESLVQPALMFRGTPVPSFSYPDYRDIRDSTKTLAGIAGRDDLAVGLVIDREAERAWGEIVTGNFFDVLGVSAWRGRVLRPADDVRGAEGVLVNITGGRDLTLHEVNEAANVVVGAAGDDANVIFGAVIDPNMDGELMITVIATGFDHMRHMTHSAGATAPMQTPVDLQSYTQVSRSQPAAAPAAAMAEAAMAARFTIARRPSIDPPLAQARQQMMMAAAGSGGGPAESSDLDLNLELEVPAFLRREG